MAHQSKSSAVTSRKLVSRCCPRLLTTLPLFEAIIEALLTYFTYVVVLASLNNKGGVFLEYFLRRTKKILFVGSFQKREKKEQKKQKKGNTFTPHTKHNTTTTPALFWTSATRDDDDDDDDDDALVVLWSQHATTPSRFDGVSDCCAYCESVC